MKPNIQVPEKVPRRHLKGIKVPWKVLKVPFLGMLMYATTRKKGLTEKLHSLGISVSYKRIMKLSTTLGNIYRLIIIQPN